MSFEERNRAELFTFAFCGTTDAFEEKLKYLAELAEEEKFKNLGGELVTTAKNFKKEIKRATSKALKYHRYKYGSLIMVNFGLSVGDELCGNHFAIVLTNDDSPFNSIITVLPLTSKSGKNKLSLGELLQKLFISYQRNILDEISNGLTEVNAEFETINKEIQKILVDKYGKKQADIIFKSNDINKYRVELPQDLKDKINNCIMKGSKYSKNYFKFDKVFEKYQDKNRISYAILNQIRTISKFRIIEPINEYDPMAKILIPKDSMLKIEKELIKKFFTKAHNLNNKVDKKQNAC